MHNRIESLRPLLITYAYNITGSLSDAEDIIQDTFIRFIAIDGRNIENPKAYLIRMVVNMAINHKNKLKKQQAAYPGQWLPEPIATEGADTSIKKRETLSYSLLVLLEKLNARQRAVFILKEAFDYEHAEIGEVIGVTEEYSRQLLSRAKKQVKAGNSQSNTISESMIHKYLEVISRADTQRLEELLNEDIMVISDGGGKASSGSNPVCGKKDVMAMLLGLYRKFYAKRDLVLHFVNNQPALFYYEGNILNTCQIISFENEKVSRVFFMRNPDKLKVLTKNLSDLSHW
ncbi:MAG: sigma-70 family RNA polymerase sigma factor [Sphingobacteriaceae bacterium]